MMLFQCAMLYFTTTLLICSGIEAKLASSTTSCSTSYAHHSPENFGQSPDKFVVEMLVLMSGQKDASSVKIQIDREWSPLGADRFYALVIEKYFDCAAFYRYVNDFIVQFGYAAEPSETAAWSSTIRDDPAALISNTRGTLTFATSGTDSRSSHLFFNFKDNSFLDAKGFTPFGIVVEGFDTLLAIYNPTPGNSGGIDQGKYESGGNEWVLANYPDVTLVQSITLTDEVPIANYTPRSSTGGGDVSSGAIKWILGGVAVLLAGVGLWIAASKLRTRNGIRNHFAAMDTSERELISAEVASNHA